jgi:hypothetical protein
LDRVLCVSRVLFPHEGTDVIDCALCAAMIGAAVGAALGFGLGPAAEKGEMILSGFLAGTPFYFIGVSLLVVELQEAGELPRSSKSDELVIAGFFSR